MAGTICLRIFLLLIISIAMLITMVMAENVILKKSPGDTDLNNRVVLESDLDSVEIGDTIHLNGIIDPSLIGGNPSDVVILISAPEGSLTDTFVLSSPDRHGRFDYDLPADVSGMWGFEALYTGLYSPKVNVEAIPSTQSGKTLLTLSGWPSYPRIGDDVTFKGRLSDATGKGITNREIIYEFATSPSGCVGGCRGPDLSAWQSAGSVRTDNSGAYSFSIPVVEEGGISVRTVFAGDEIYLNSKSREIGITSTGS